MMSASRDRERIAACTRAYTAATVFSRGDFLQYFNVFFDYGQHFVYLEPNDTYKRRVIR